MISIGNHSLPYPLSCARTRAAKECISPPLHHTHARTREAQRARKPKSPNWLPKSYRSASFYNRKGPTSVNLMGRTLFCLERFVAHFVALVADARALFPKNQTHTHPPHTRSYSPSEPSGEISNERTHFVTTRRAR